MHVDWETLVKVENTKAIDVWYLFPLSGALRQLTRKEERMDADKKRSLDRILGTTEWRQAFYEVDRPDDLFGGGAIERHADSTAIEKWITTRLKSQFPLVLGPAVLRRGVAHRKVEHPGLFPTEVDPNVLKRGTRQQAAGGPALFALYFLVSNPSPPAQALTRKLGNGVLAKLKRESGV
jgi:hypothetical protein